MFHRNKLWWCENDDKPVIITNHNHQRYSHKGTTSPTMRKKTRFCLSRLFVRISKNDERSVLPKHAHKSEVNERKIGLIAFVTQQQNWKGGWFCSRIFCCFYLRCWIWWEKMKDNQQRGWWMGFKKRFTLFVLFSSQ